MKTPKVIIETSYRDHPKEHELSAALLVARHFNTDIVFLRPTQQRTPDLDISGHKWELKSPIGDGKNTIKNNLHNARKQSSRIVIDLRRMKMPQEKAISNIRYYFSSHHSQIKHLIVITKTEKILEIL